MDEYARCGVLATSCWMESGIPHHHQGGLVRRGWPVRAMKTINEWADILNDCLGNPDREDLAAQLAELNSSLDVMAHSITGVSAAAVSDENLEGSSRVLYWWTTRAQLMSKVLLLAANRQTFHREFEK